MSADFENAGNQAQLELLMARLLNVGITVFGILSFAMSELQLSTYKHIGCKQPRPPLGVQDLGMRLAQQHSMPANDVA